MIHDIHISDKRLLYSPLNWGMGHVARSIGLIRDLLDQNNTVFVACNESQRKVYETYFQELIYIKHDGYPFQFNGKGKFGSDLLRRIGPLAVRMRKEKEETSRYVKDNSIDVVLSDHRYGFYTDEVPSILITHQVHLPLKWYQFTASWLHRKYLSNFSNYWIMDYDNNSLAGMLSKQDDSGKGLYIGPFSRFKLYDVRPEKDIGRVLVASGPQVYAQQLIDEVLNDGEDHSDLVVICEDDLFVPEEIPRVNGSWKDKDATILRAKKLISRSGYSTIMDVVELGCLVKYYPTPGQFEQEYLAQLHEN